MKVFFFHLSANYSITEARCVQERDKRRLVYKQTSQAQISKPLTNWIATVTTTQNLPVIFPSQSQRIVLRTQRVMLLASVPFYTLVCHFARQRVISHGFFVLTNSAHSFVRLNTGLCFQRAFKTKEF